MPPPIGYGNQLRRDDPELISEPRRAWQVGFRCVSSQEGAGMNRFDPRPSGAVEARVEFLDGDFRILRPGAFVRCAVTGAPIPIDELRYWSVDRQEAYADPEAVLKRLGERP
jgi:hypothetical protein